MFSIVSITGVPGVVCAMVIVVASVYVVRDVMVAGDGCFTTDLRV